MFEDTKRILVINVNWIGDVLLSTPALKAIRERFPHAFIASLVTSTCREALMDNPHIHEVISYDKKGEHKNPWGKFRLLRAIREKRFDTVFVFHRSRTRALLAYLSGARYRIGYNTKKRGFLLTTKITPPPGETHKIDYFLGIVRTLDASERKEYSRELVFVVNAAAEKYIRELLESRGISENDFLVGLNPGANWQPKQWTASGFAALGDELYKKHPVKIVISGAVKDISLAREIAAKMKAKPLILAGETTLRQLAALIKRCGLFITADSGPMHIARAVQTPLVALFGPTSITETGPVGKGPYRVVQNKIACAPCTRIICRDNQCMKNITPDDVLEAAEELIGKGDIAG